MGLTRALFLYGTLCDPALLNTVLGRVPDCDEATLADHQVRWARGECFPVLVGTLGETAPGLLLRDLSDKDFARLDFYEGPYGYRLIPVSVRCGSATVQAELYAPPENGLEPGDPWDLSVWQARYGPVLREAAKEIMESFDAHGAQSVAARVPVIRARAQARVNARTRTSPVGLRHGFDRADVREIDHRRPYSKFFTTEELDLSYRQFDGSWSAPVERAIFVSSDAVTVLPYDPERDRVLLIEQFRAGPYLRGDLRPWALEAIAGRIDAFETAEDTAHREAQEEAGLKLGELHLVARYYPTSGAKSEYLTSFVAIADLPETGTGRGGLDSEAEDIRTIVVPFESLMAAVTTGEVENAALLVSALWLERERARLRQSG